MPIPPLLSVFQVSVGHWDGTKSLPVSLSKEFKFNISAVWKINAIGFRDLAKWDSDLYLSNWIPLGLPIVSPFHLCQANFHRLVKLKDRNFLSEVWMRISTFMFRWMTMWNLWQTWSPKLSGSGAVGGLNSTIRYLLLNLLPFYLLVWWGLPTY